MLRKTFFKVIGHLVPNSVFTLRSIGKLSKIYKSDKFFFIQIGANNGLLDDPINHYIKKYHWKGILVEPVHEYFNSLKKTYAMEKGLFFENSAISDRRGKKRIYRLKHGVKNIARWYQGLASFDKDNLIAHKFGFPEIEKYIEEETVNCITLLDLVSKYKAKKVDLLCIDVEGYEMTIIKQIPLLKVKPSIILYEHKHLNKNDRQECHGILVGLGYTLSRKITDTICYLED